MWVGIRKQESSKEIGEPQQAHIASQNPPNSILTNTSVVSEGKKTSNEPVIPLTRIQSQKKSRVELPQRNSRPPPRKAQATSPYPHSFNHSQHQATRAKSQRESITSADYLLYFDAKKRNDELTRELSEKQKRIQDLEFLVKTQKSFIDEFMKNVRSGQNLISNEHDTQKTIQESILSSPEAHPGKTLRIHKSLLPKKRPYSDEQSFGSRINVIDGESLPIQTNLEAEAEEIDAFDKELGESTEDICWSIFVPLSKPIENISDTDSTSVLASSSLHSILDVLTGMFNIWSSRLTDTVLQISYQYYALNKTKSMSLSSSITYWFEDEASSAPTLPYMFSTTSYFSTLNPISFFFFLSALYESDSEYPYQRHLANSSFFSLKNDISLDLYVRQYLMTFSKALTSYALSTSNLSMPPAILSPGLSPLNVFEAFDALEAEQVVAMIILRILVLVCENETIEESESFFKKHPKTSFHWLHEELSDQNRLLLTISNANSPKERPQGKKAKTESKISASGVPSTILSSWELALLREIQIPQAPLRVLVVAYSLGILQGQLMEKISKEHSQLKVEQLERVIFTSLSLICNPSAGYPEQTIITVMAILSSFMRVVDADTSRGKTMDIFYFSNLDGEKLHTLYTLVSTLEFLFEDFFASIITSHFELSLQSKDADTSQFSYSFSLKAKQSNSQSVLNPSIFGILWSNAKLPILHETRDFLRGIIQTISAIIGEKEASEKAQYSPIFSLFTLSIPNDDSHSCSPGLKYGSDFVTSSHLDEMMEIVLAQRRSDLITSLLTVSKQKYADDESKEKNTYKDKVKINSCSNFPTTLPYYFQLVLEVIIRNSPLMYMRSVALPGIILPGLSKYARKYTSQLSSPPAMPFLSQNHMLNTIRLRLLSHISAIFTTVSLCLSNYSLLLCANDPSDVSNSSANIHSQTTTASLVSLDQLSSISLAVIDVVRILLSSHDRMERGKSSHVKTPISLISSLTLSLPLGISEQLDASHVFVDPVDNLNSSLLLSLVEESGNDDVIKDGLRRDLRLSGQIQEEICYVVNQLQVYFDSILQSLLPFEYQSANVVTVEEDMD